MFKCHNILLVFILISFLACEKDTDSLPEDVEFAIKPSDPLTTDVLIFEAGQPGQEKGEVNLFFRWDWDGDAEWDTEFSKVKTITKRFYKPGDFEIIMQYSDGKGNTSSVKKNIKVGQGYSAPKPSFTISPETGNYLQEFIFDASQTRDDEDSLNQLLFRWDFQGDGNWDTPFDTIPVVKKTYNKTGYYSPEVEVKDPSNKIASFKKELEVTNIDHKINIRVTWTPEDISVGDTISFDASGSYYGDGSEMSCLVSWYFPDNPVWTAPSRETNISYVFRREGKNALRCKIILDNSTLENTASFEIFAAKENRPPEPAFEVAIPYGNIHTQFYFDCWGTRDDNLSPTQIMLRWDWNGDGEWDTPFKLEKDFFHQYTEPGIYNFILQAKDDKLATSEVTGQVTVSQYNNETGYFRDSRDGNLYGTVKIGTRWWMAENLRFEIPEKTKSGLEATLCLFEQESWCQSIGQLYHVSSVTNDRFDDREFDVCPNGWKIPLKEDIESLIQNLGGDDYAKELMFGGKSDFNGIYAGYGSFIITGGMIEPFDTVYSFEETYENFYHTSNSIAPDINEARSDIYMIRISRSDGSLWKGYNTARFYMPIRCIKE
jgi:uncharacterized protein (TIGR02145 family)